MMVEAVPCAEKVVFANSGTEATMLGMRVARGFSGKTRVAVFGGAYHGMHDYALVQDDPKSPADSPTAKTTGRGVPDAVRDETMLILPYHDDAAFELIRRHADELALVVIQPVQNNTPRIDNHDFLRTLRTVCEECDVLLMFDEVVTGFRLAYGGGQEYFGVTPDLATYGKIIGGGTPVGALCGPAEILDLFTKAGRGGVAGGGTFSGNAITMAAGAATLRLLKERQGEIYPALERKGNRLADAINTYGEEQGLDICHMHAASIHCLHFVKGPIGTFREAYPPNHIAEEAFYIFLLERGVLIPPVHLFLLSVAHTDEHIDRVISACIESLDDCRADGLFDR
jgi:glutamate-1-semialdehyde 2,1-aminomutase